MGNCLGFFSNDLDPEEQWAEQEEEPPQHYREQVPLGPSRAYAATRSAQQQWSRAARLRTIRQHLPLEAFALEAGAGKGEGPECAICCADLACGDLVRRLRCGHVYHADCIDEWLMRDFTCPCCRDKVDEGWPATQTT